MAAARANTWPWANARKNAMGPDVNGSPTSQPLTPGPQRRPARLTAPISAGVTISLSARRGEIISGQAWISAEECGASEACPTLFGGNISLIHVQHHLSLVVRRRVAHPGVLHRRAHRGNLHPLAAVHILDLQVHPNHPIRAQS